MQIVLVPPVPEEQKVHICMTKSEAATLKSVVACLVSQERPVAAVLNDLYGVLASVGIECSSPTYKTVRLEKQ